MWRQISGSNYVDTYPSFPLTSSAIAANEIFCVSWWINWHYCAEFIYSQTVIKPRLAFYHQFSESVIYPSYMPTLIWNVYHLSLFINTSWLEWNDNDSESGKQTLSFSVPLYVFNSILDQHARRMCRHGQPNIYGDSVLMCKHLAYSSYNEITWKPVCCNITLGYKSS